MHTAWGKGEGGGGGEEGGEASEVETESSTVSTHHMLVEGYGAPEVLEAVFTDVYLGEPGEVWGVG